MLANWTLAKRPVSLCLTRAYWHILTQYTVPRLHHTANSSLKTAYWSSQPSNHSHSSFFQHATVHMASPIPTYRRHPHFPLPFLYPSPNSTWKPPCLPRTGAWGLYCGRHRKRKPHLDKCIKFVLLCSNQKWSISNFPRSLTRNITSHSMKNLAFHRLLRWKMTILSILTTSLAHPLFQKVGRIYFLNLGWKGQFPPHACAIYVPNLCRGEPECLIPQVCLQKD